MEDLQKRQEIVANDNVAPEQPEQAVEIEKIIEELKAQGLEDEAILEALNQMLQEGKITDEDLAKAQEILNGEDKAEASKLFGVDIM